MVENKKMNQAAKLQNLVNGATKPSTDKGSNVVDQSFQENEPLMDNGYDQLNEGGEYGGYEGYPPQMMHPNEMGQMNGEYQQVEYENEQIERSKSMRAKSMVGSSFENGRIYE
jgi:hypothetical protein